MELKDDRLGGLGLPAHATQGTTTASKAAPTANNRAGLTAPLLIPRSVTSNHCNGSLLTLTAWMSLCVCTTPGPASTFCLSSATRLRHLCRQCSLRVCRRQQGSWNRKSYIGIPLTEQQKRWHSKGIISRHEGTVHPRHTLHSHVLVYENFSERGKSVQGGVFSSLQRCHIFSRNPTRVLSSFCAEWKLCIVTSEDDDPNIH